MKIFAFVLIATVLEATGDAVVARCTAPFIPFRPDRTFLSRRHAADTLRNFSQSGSG